jgi:hypothetical protein
MEVIPPTDMDIYADDRDALNDFAKYYNNNHLSVTPSSHNPIKKAVNLHV